MGNKLKHLSKKELWEMELKNNKEVHRGIKQREDHLKEKLLKSLMTEDLNYLLNYYQKRFNKFQLEEGYFFENSNIKTDYMRYHWSLNYKNFFGIGLLKESIFISVNGDEPVNESKKNKSKLVFNVGFTPHFENIDKNHFNLSYIQTINIIKKHFQQRYEWGSPKDKTS